MQKQRVVGLFVLAAGFAALWSGLAYGQVHSGVHPVPAVVRQVIKAFDNPEGAVFSASGRFLFISNSAELGTDRAPAFGWAEGEGYISKLEVQPSGELKMVNDKLITGLTAPLGMGVLPVDTAKFPAGTIFLCVGSAPLRNAQGELIRERKHLQTKLLAFDEEGQILGEIKTGPGSIFEELTGSPIILINALGFDPKGNLFVADTAFGGDQFMPPFEPKGGLWMIPVNALDDLADGKTPETKPSFLPIPGNPDGVEVSPVDGKIYVNTVGPVAGAPDPADGGVYAVTLHHLTGPNRVTGLLPPPIDRYMGALDGLVFTTGGAMLNTQIRGDKPHHIYVNCPGKLATTLVIEPAGAMAELTGPADLALRRLPDGSHIVAVPELFARDTTPGDDEVTVLLLPPHFDAACEG